MEMGRLAVQLAKLKYPQVEHAYIWLETTTQFVLDQFTVFGDICRSLAVRFGIRRTIKMFKKTVQFMRSMRFPRGASDHALTQFYPSTKRFLRR